MTECQRNDCEKDAEVSRTFRRDHTEYQYCSDHDPLNDPNAEWAYIEGSKQ